MTEKGTESHKMVLEKRECPHLHDIVRVLARDVGKRVLETLSFKERPGSMVSTTE